MNNPVDVKLYFQPGEIDRLKDYVIKGYSHTVKQINISAANNKLKKLMRR